jgi:hypothetical protein
MPRIKRAKKKTVGPVLGLRPAPLARKLISKALRTNKYKNPNQLLNHCVVKALEPQP